ncbi:MAG: DUF1801 domain-containing protein [Casimicrobiaceae bacterium]
MQSKAPTVDAYLAELPDAKRATLAGLRALIRKSAPKAREHMAHGMPGYSIGDSLLCAMAAQKNNFALYVCNAPLVDRYRARLGTKDIGKGCIRFKRPEDLAHNAAGELVAEAYRNAAR